MDGGWDCTVFCRKDGRWISRSNGGDGVMTVHDTKKEAIDAARAMLSHHGGGRLTVKGKDGRVKIKDTIRTSTGYLDSDILLSSA
jgi:hypothetical protein